MIDTIIEAGIIFLLAYTPLAFGGVTPGAQAVLQTLSAALLLLWLVRQLFIKDGSLNIAAFQPQHKISPAAPFIQLITIGASLLFLGFSYLQTVALPASFIKILSPAAYALYSEAALNTAAELPSHLPLSIYAYTTKSEWGKLVAYAIVFFLIARVIRTQKQLNRLLHVIFVLGCLQAVYGFLQYFSGTTLLDLYPARGSSVSGSFVNKNHFAGYLEMVIPLNFSLLLTQFQRNGAATRKLSPGHFRETYPKVFLLLLALSVTIASLLLSGSRGGILSFNGATMLFVLLARQRRLLRRRVMQILLIVLLVVILTIVLDPDVLTKHLHTFRTLDVESVFDTRWELWKSALHIFREYPVSGAGLGSFTHLNPRYRTFRTHLRHYEYAENDYLQWLAEGGIIGSVLLLLMGSGLATSLLSGWKNRHSRWKVAMTTGGISGMFSVLLHSGTDFNLHIPSNALLFVTIAAVCVNILRLPSSRRNSSDGTETFPRNRGTVSWTRTAVILPLFFLTALFLFHSAKRYMASRHYRYAVSQNAPEDTTDSTQDSYMPDSLDAFERAVRLAPNNADYHHALGKLLLNRASSNAFETETASALFSESERRIKRSIMLQPGNSWQYYDLGRMKIGHEDSAAARYFQAALKNAPKEMFLRESVGQWFLFYDRNEGQRLMRELAAGDSPSPVEDPNAIEHFARLLYRYHLDDEAEPKRSTHCQPKQLSGNSLSEVLEFGNDTGVAEWSAPLTNDTDRIRKVLCLPEDLSVYRYSALRIYMSNGGQKDFTAHITIDGQRIKSFERTVPRLAKWYEIPFENTFLEDRSYINVYIRVENASENGNFLQIWGDSQTPNSHSTWRFDTTDDLSIKEGVQQGEYLIRLVLRK